MKMPWVILILIFPIMGVGLYLLIGLNGGTHKMRERYAEIDSKLLPMLPDNQECLRRIKEQDSPKQEILQVTYKEMRLSSLSEYGYHVYYDEAVKGLEAQLEELQRLKSLFLWNIMR